MSSNDPKGPGGGHLIFRPWFIHAKTGKKIYPKSGKVFPIWVVDPDDNGE